MNKLTYRNQKTGECNACGRDVLSGEGWCGWRTPDTGSPAVYCAEHREEARRDGVWDLAYDLTSAVDGGVAVDFFRPAWREFERLLREGIVAESDRDLFMESWGAQNWFFILANEDLMEGDPEETTSTE